MPAQTPIGVVIHFLRKTILFANLASHPISAAARIVCACALVNNHVISMIRTNEEIAVRVVSRVTVNVMDASSLRKALAKYSFCNQNMFLDMPTFVDDVLS